MPTAQDAMIEQAARMALRYAARLRPVAGYTRDEALQDARIGAWGALGAACETDADGHADPLRLLALAGYRNILDGRSTRWRRSAGGAREFELGEEHDGEAPDGAAGLLAVGQVLRAIERLRPPLPEIARLLIEGYEAAEIGARLGVSAARIGQHRRRLQRTVSQLMGVGA